MGKLLAVFDPSGKLGLTAPSPGGGTVPTRWWCYGELQPRPYCDDCRQILLLVTSDGTPEPIGMARAREVLARSLGIIPVLGVAFGRWAGGWSMWAGPFGQSWDALPDESAPEALARLLAEHAGCEVVR